MILWSLRMSNFLIVVNEKKEALGDSENTNAPRRAEGALHLADGTKTENRQYIKY
jgi:hypothetical protein